MSPRYTLESLLTRPEDLKVLNSLKPFVRTLRQFPASHSKFYIATTPSLSDTVLTTGSNFLAVLTLIISGAVYYCYPGLQASVIKHALVPNGWEGVWLGGVVVAGGGGGGRGAKAKVHSTFWVVRGVGGVGWVVVVVLVRGRRQRCIVPSGR